MRLKYLSLLSMTYSTKIIKNISVPACKNCVHYIPNTSSGKFATDFGTCAKFGSKNILTDVITYKYIDSCRNNNTLCGIDGVHFEKEPDLNNKMRKHFFIANSGLILVSSLVFSPWLFIIYYLIKPI